MPKKWQPKQIKGVNKIRNNGKTRKNHNQINQQITNQDTKLVKVLISLAHQHNIT